MGRSGVGEAEAHIDDIWDAPPTNTGRSNLAVFCGHHGRARSSAIGQSDKCWAPGGVVCQPR